MQFLFDGNVVRSNTVQKLRDFISQSVATQAKK